MSSGALLSTSIGFTSAAFFGSTLLYSSTGLSITAGTFAIPASGTFSASFSTDTLTCETIYLASAEGLPSFHVDSCYLDSFLVGGFFTGMSFLTGDYSFETTLDFGVCNIEEPLDTEGVFAIVLLAPILV